MGRARVHVATELLGLPEGTTVEQAYVIAQQGVISLVVSHPDLPVVEPEMVPPLVAVVAERTVVEAHWCDIPSRNSTADVTGGD